jgi:hypothetical protein
MQTGSRLRIAQCAAGMALITVARPPAMKGIDFQ